MVQLNFDFFCFLRSASNCRTKSVTKMATSSGRPMSTLNSFTDLYRRVGLTKQVRQQFLLLRDTHNSSDAQQNINEESRQAAMYNMYSRILEISSRRSDPRGAEFFLNHLYDFFKLQNKCIQQPKHFLCNFVIFDFVSTGKEIV